MTDKQLQEAAYYNWLNKGCPENADLDCWLEAEKSSQGGVAQKTEKKSVAKPVAKKTCVKAKKATKKATRK